MRCRCRHRRGTRAGAVRSVGFHRGLHKIHAVTQGLIILLRAEFSDHEAHERGAILQRECLLLRIRADLDLKVRRRLHEEHIHAVHAVLLRLLERPLVIHFRHRRLVLVVHTRLHLRGDFLERLDEHALAQRALHLADHLHGVGLRLLGKERAIVNHTAAARAAESRAEEQHREDAQHACEDAA